MKNSRDKMPTLSDLLDEYDEYIAEESSENTYNSEKSYKKEYFNLLHNYNDLKQLYNYNTSVLRSAAMLIAFLVSIIIFDSTHIATEIYSLCVNIPSISVIALWVVIYIVLFIVLYLIATGILPLLSDGYNSFFNPGKNLKNKIIFVLILNVVFFGGMSCYGNMIANIKAENEEIEKEAVETESHSPNEDLIVYISGKGIKYHLEDCHIIAKLNPTPISLKTAVNEGYEPCSVCNPPEL